MSLLVTYNCVYHQNLMYVADSSYEKATILRYLNLFFSQNKFFYFKGLFLFALVLLCVSSFRWYHLQDELDAPPKTAP